MIEHLSFPEAFRMLSESFRVLKPGGWMRLATPDLGRLVTLFSRQSTQDHHFMEQVTTQWIPWAWKASPAFVLNNALHAWGHRFLFDKPTLDETLQRIGFAARHWTSPGHSSHEPFRDFDLRHRDPSSRSLNLWETMVVEAQRPLA